MDLETKRKALEKLLMALNTRMDNRLKLINSKEDNSHSLLESAQEYCQLLASRRVLEEELVRVISAAINSPINTA